MAFQKMNNFQVTEIFTLFEGVLLLSSYYFALRKKIYKRIILIFVPLFLIGYALVYFTVSINQVIPPYIFAFHHLFMLSAILLYFAERLQLMDEIDITLDPMFWVSSGFLLFYSVSIFYFSLYHYLFQHYMQVFVKGLWIHSFTLIIMNILLAKGLWLVPKKQI